MNDAPTIPAQTASPPKGNTQTAAAEKPSRAATLIRVIRAMIDIGRQRIATLRAQPDPQETRDIACAFGTCNLALIVARILRGLRLAAALETRVTAAAPRIDTPRVEMPRAAGTLSPKRAARPPRKSKLSEAEDSAALLARLPTEQEIADMIRRRPIGAVLVDICRDLGIGTDHPLWQDLRDLIVEHNGQLGPIMMGTIRRILDAHRELNPTPPPALAFHPEAPQIAGTGPPPLALAA